SELVRFCLDMLHTGPLSSFARVSEPIRYRQTSEVVRALAGSLAAAENTAIAEAAEWTLGEVAKEQTDPVTAQDLRVLLSQIPLPGLLARSAEWLSWARATADWPAIHVLARLARAGNPAAVGELHRKAAQGDRE